MREVKLVAIDADGTLVNGDGCVTPRVRAALHAVVERGVKFVLATGRAHDGARLVLGDLGLDAGLILVNGALLADGLAEPCFARAMLPTDAARLAVGAIQAAGHAPFVYEDPERGDHIALEDRHTLMPAFIAERRDAHLLADLDDWLDHPVLVIVAAGDGPAMQGLKAELAALLAGRAEVECAHYQAGLWVVTVVAVGCNKADGLERFAARHGIALAQVMAIGDGHNDVEMLRRAGWGVAMGNASPEVKAVADQVVADNHHDGVAEALALVGSAQGTVPERSRRVHDGAQV